MKVDATRINAAIRILTKANRKSATRNVNLAGRSLTIFASKNCKVESKGYIENWLRSRAKHPYWRRYKSNRKGEFDGTRVAAIVGAIHRRKGIRTGSTIYKKEVRSFLRKAKKGSGYHKAGFIPALKSFKAKVKGGRRRGTGRYQNPIPGKASAARKSQGLKPHAYLENFARGITKAQPMLLKRQEGPVARQLLKFAYQDMIKNARKAGFSTR